jgi:hypothetical protein
MSVFLEQSLNGGRIVLVVVADYGFPVLGGSHAFDTGQQYLLFFKIQYYIGCLPILGTQFLLMVMTSSICPEALV